eukprot:1153532-Pelagomonas_calceolata.AAC.3
MVSEGWGWGWPCVTRLRARVMSSFWAVMVACREARWVAWLTSWAWHLASWASRSASSACIEESMEEVRPCEGHVSPRVGQGAVLGVHA